MTRTVPQFHTVLNTMGTDVTYHRESGGAVCPCRSPEGFRTPSWHEDPAHAAATVCNEEGMLPVVTEHLVKASIQPATIGLRGRGAERVVSLLGTIQRDDHFGIFPCAWGGATLDFYAFSDSGDDYIVYDNRRFLVVAADKIPDVDGDPNHHWEVGLRRIKDARPA